MGRLVTRAQGKMGKGSKGITPKINENTENNHKR